LRGTWGVACSLTYKTVDKRLGFGGSLALEQIKIDSMHYASTGSAPISASISAKSSGKLEVTLFPAEGDEDTSWTGTPVLVRLALPVPGTFGFVSVRFPVSLEYKVPLPPITAGINFTADIVNGVGSNVQITPFALGVSSTSPSTEFAFAVEGYARVMTGAELAVTSVPSAFASALPSSTDDLAKIGAYFKVGPAGKFGWKVRTADELNCRQLTDVATEWFAQLSVNTALSTLFGDAGWSASQKLKKMGFDDADFGNCLDAIAFEPASAKAKTGQPLDVRPFLKALKVGGKPMTVPSGFSFAARPPQSGAVIDSTTGIFQASQQGTYAVGATSATGLRSVDFDITADQGPVEPSPLPTDIFLTAQSGSGNEFTCLISETCTSSSFAYLVNVRCRSNGVIVPCFQQVVFSAEIYTWTIDSGWSSQRVRAQLFGQFYPDYGNAYNPPRVASVSFARQGWSPLVGWTYARSLEIQISSLGADKSLDGTYSLGNTVRFVDDVPFYSVRDCSVRGTIQELRSPYCYLANDLPGTSGPSNFP
jgi:hypothetical protein